MRGLPFAVATVGIAGALFGCWVFQSVDALPSADDGGTAPIADAGPDARSFRRPIVIAAGTDEVPLGYSIRVPLDDLRALVDQGKVRSDLSDVRVRAVQGPSRPDEERDRVVDVAPEGEVPAVWFSTSAAIPAHASETRYELDYGDRSLGPARADGPSVFAFYDDFAGSQVSPQKWTTKGAVELDGGVVLRHAPGGAVSEIDSTATMAAASSLEVIASVSQATSPKHSLGYNAGFRWCLWLGEDPSGAFRAYQSACDGGAECLGPLIPLPDANLHVYRIDRAPSQTRYAFAGERTPRFSVDANDGKGMPLSFSNASPQSDLVLQRVRVRLLIADEPSVTLGPEEALP